MIQMLVDFGNPTLQGELIYRRSEYSFDFEPVSRVEVRRRAGEAGSTSILVGTLQVEIGIETGTLLYIWGYHPHTVWRKRRLSNPSGQPGMVRVSLAEPLEPGISIGVVEVNEWGTAYDSGTGWVCIGESMPSKNALYIEFATNTIAVIEGAELRAIWLRPTNNAST